MCYFFNPLVPAEKEDSSDDEADDETETTEGGQGSNATTAEPNKVIGDVSAATNGGAPDSNEISEEAHESGNAEEPNEEETDIKLAWEILELARVICQK